MKKVVCLLLTVLTVFYIFAGVLPLWQYYDHLNSLRLEAQREGVLLDFAKPYPNLGLVMLSGFGIALLWVSLLKYKRSVATVLCVAILAWMLAYGFRVREVNATVPSHVDVVVDMLCAGDEEWMLGAESNIEQFESSLAHANSKTVFSECFEVTFGIHFEIRGWTSWNSSNYLHDPIQLVLEAWQQIGYSYGMRYNGYIIDMLALFTGQDIEGYWACSFPDANITLIEENLEGHPGFVRHELTHMFNCSDCGESWCIMNPLLVGIKYPMVWGSECKKHLTNPNKLKFSIISDVNKDYTVNIKDAVIIGRAFGTSPGMEAWDVLADVNMDSRVNIKDTVIMGVKFGWAK